jgi:hypothetical protein
MGRGLEHVAHVESELRGNPASYELMGKDKKGQAGSKVEIQANDQTW